MATILKHFNHYCVYIIHIIIHTYFTVTGPFIELQPILSTILPMYLTVVLAIPHAAPPPPPAAEVRQNYNIKLKTVGTIKYLLQR